MKRKVLKPRIEKLLKIIAIVCLPVMMLDDFNTKYTFIVLHMVLLEVTSCYLLINYGRGNR